jgi:DNA mismatch endonuclease (patch repair protein)
MDIKSREKRSINMASIKARDTKPELFIRMLLYSNGIRYRLHRKDIPGKPDLFISKYNTAVFINGCFWHQHKGCRESYMPKSNIKFWKGKLEKNIKRDNENIKKLRKEGYKVIIIWECTIKKLKSDKDKNEFLTDLIKKIADKNIMFYSPQDGKREE